MRGLRILRAPSALTTRRARYLQSSRIQPAAKAPKARFHRLSTAAMSAPIHPPPMHSKPDLPSPGALLPCQLDSYARSGTATILACEAAAAPSKPAKGKKAASKGSAAATSGAASASDGTLPGRRWVVTLNGGPLYPEGGGQPSDTGILRAISDIGSGGEGGHAGNGSIAAEAHASGGNSGTAPAALASAPAAAAVAETADAARATDAVNVLSVTRSDDGDVLATVDKPLPVGARVSVSVDWHRRFDLMQQHTGACTFRSLSC